MQKRTVLWLLIFVIGLISCTTSKETTPEDSTLGGTWTTRAPLLEANSEMAVAELAGRIYVFGGYPSSRQTVNTVQIYDSGSDSWSYGEPLRVGAGVHGVVVEQQGAVRVQSVGSVLTVRRRRR